jgi:hypothetical protein
MTVEERLAQQAKADEALIKALKKIGNKRVLEIAKDVTDMNIGGVTMEEYNEKALGNKPIRRPKK